MFSVLWGSYAQHVKEAWQKRTHPNLHIIFFEDLKADIMGELRKLNTFLDAKLSEEKLTELAKYTSFSEMKARNVVFGQKEEEVEFLNKDALKEDGGFMRKGKSLFLFLTHVSTLMKVLIVTLALLFKSLPLFLCIETL